MAAAGETAARIASAIGCDHATVCGWARKQGLVLTKHWEKPKSKPAHSDVTQAMLRELYDYDPGTGLLTHRVARSHNVKIGQQVGHLDRRNPSYPRWTLRLLGRSWILSRVIWMYVHGEWPRGQIDHINGDPTDNRLSNLRDVCASVNMQNKRRAVATNSTGYLGVSVHHGGKKPFLARIRDPKSGQRQIRLGYFATAEEAHNAYVEAKRRLHSGCTL